jgi:L-threonylcarbamoyladenylate synthase
MANNIQPAGPDETLRNAAQCILNGGIIAYPTETVYGLGARYDDDEILGRLYNLKKRPTDKTMPLIIGAVSDLDLLVEHITDSAGKIMETLWPGPLTLVFRAKKGLSAYIIRESGIALRMPGESFALKLVRTVGMPITSTSANISGMPPARDALTAARYFGLEVDMIIDGGASPSDTPSTIIDVTTEPFRLLREGPVSLADILSALQKR